ncbi:type 2 lanthipeptide synthetase LanM family protein [Catenulispora pinisilvae]|uniref:type 2 lanthipeptide synthetase LanM family protein n=1 Tax=Catenulispora pinisilvae TaxID=2705253 RepID=UPI002B2750E9|nr:type 2 lanthipeptide synthetase LanM family protein [Catenulispora pinisilvae]
MTSRFSGEFAGALGCLAAPISAGLAARLGDIADLSGGERAAVVEAAERAVIETVHRKVSRVLLLELNAARLSGLLTSDDAGERWSEFLAIADDTEFWHGLGARYPTLERRLNAVMQRRADAALALAQRFAADRGSLASLAATDLGDLRRVEFGELRRVEFGELRRVEFGAGDSHRGGQSVAILDLGDAKLVYKPRPVEVDKALARLLDTVFPDVPAAERIRVPAVIAREGYGWSEYIPHRYCASDAELTAFYRGVGHWLAVMRLLGGSDLHTENVIAHGPVPVVVDCETLFSTIPDGPPSGLGQAVDLAAKLVDETVLRVGMLPSRGAALGWRGVDSSSVGALPDEQPAGQVPVILDAGTDRAHLGFAEATPEPAASLPSPKPVLADHWETVAAGFEEGSAALAAADASGVLEPAVAAFGDCRIRMVLRATDVYEEVARMLWHPVSLHDEATAVERATELFVQMARQSPAAPGDPDVIAAEIDDLLHGDIPYFGTTPRTGRLTGPGGTYWLPSQDLVADALARWRSADLGFDRSIIRATLVSAYLNADWTPSKGLRPVRAARHSAIDARRRALAAGLVRQVRDSATRGADGTATWIAPVLSLTGWVVQPLSPDLYSGLPGVALLLAGYQHETEGGRADPIDGIPDLLAATLHTMRLAAAHAAKLRSEGVALRPREPGGWVGLGSELWTWLTLRRLGAVGDEGLDQARTLAALIPDAIGDAEEYELVSGPAGAVVPLLQLARVTGERQWTETASRIGSVLCDAALAKEVGVSWPTTRWPGGLGGCAHGASGIGWALARLALATGGTRTADHSRVADGSRAARDTRAADVARAAFAFEESCYDPKAGGWLDLREIEPGLTANAWCHGSVGIALTQLDLARRGWPIADDLLRRAAQAAHTNGMGWNHTLCHGDLGVWELMEAALRADSAPPGVDREGFEAHIVTSLEENGAISGMARDAFSPAMMSGLGGVAYQLLRMGAGNELPSVLVLDDPL